MSAIKLNTELRNNELLLLYSLIEKGLNQVEQGKVKPMREIIKFIRKQT
jgi:hypothetical protein